MTRANASQQLDHFAATSRQDIIAGKEALMAGDMNRFEQLLEKIRNSDVAKSITNMAANADGFLDSVVEEVRRVIPGANVVRGLVIVAAGAIFWGSQMVLGPVIAVCLMAYGIGIAFPAVWEMIANRFDELFSGFSS